MARTGVLALAYSARQLCRAGANAVGGQRSSQSHLGDRPAWDQVVTTERDPSLLSSTCLGLVVTVGLPLLLERSNVERNLYAWTGSAQQVRDETARWPRGMFGLQVTDGRERSGTRCSSPRGEPSFGGLEHPSLDTREGNRRGSRPGAWNGCAESSRVLRYRVGSEKWLRRPARRD